jgi:hypothetical protein
MVILLSRVVCLDHRRDGREMKQREQPFGWSRLSHLMLDLDRERERKIDPRPRSDSTDNCPPCISMMRFEIDNPRPVSTASSVTDFTPASGETFREPKNSH